MTIALTTEGVSKGALESIIFPSSVTVGENKPWSAVVRNTGGLGSIALGIVNSSGNPSAIIVTYNGVEYPIELGYYLRLSKTNVPNNDTLSSNGDVKFSVAGTYSIKLWAMHLEGSTWIYDQEIVKSVVVTTVTPPPPPPPTPDILDQIKKSIKEHPLEYALIGIGAFTIWNSSKQKKE